MIIKYLKDNRMIKITVKIRPAVLRWFNINLLDFNPDFVLSLRSIEKQLSATIMIMYIALSPEYIIEDTIEDGVALVIENEETKIAINSSHK